MLTIEKTRNLEETSKTEPILMDYIEFTYLVGTNWDTSSAIMFVFVEYFFIACSVGISRPTQCYFSPTVPFHSPNILCCLFANPLCLFL
jgi:hypothetical protein